MFDFLSESMKNRADVKKNDHEALHFLLWHDCIERLDTLLLEALHVQVNIIYALQVPALYLYLEWEENKLWAEKKDDWDDYIENEGKLDDVVKWVVLLYPDQKNNKKEELAKLEERVKLAESEELEKLLKFKKSVMDAVEDKKKNRYWNTDQRHSYLSLRKLQILKQNIFRDKLILCRHGFYAFRNKRNKETAQSKLLLLRSAILEKIRNYIERIGDHQAHFSKTHDIGLQDHPRPAMERRREQGIYSTYLSTYCKDVGREINLLLDVFKKKSKDATIQWYEPKIIHRWNHDFTSRSKTFVNEVEFEEDDDKSNYHFYVNSSYWTPDRPDLQSILTHECAHGIIKTRLDNLSESGLSRKDDVFIKLICQINHCLDVYGVESRLHSKGLRLEIAVDLVAATINNMAYLYAIFLEMISNGLANLFTWGDVVDGYDLSLIDHLEGAAGNHIIEYGWYIRLSIICIWLEEIYNKNKKSLERTNTTKSVIQQINIRLISSCQFVLDQQLDYLESITPQEQKNGDYLKVLLEQIRRCIKSSDAVKQAANWCLERAQAFSSWDNRDNKKPHQFPRRSKPLCPLAQILALQSFRLNIESINGEKSDEALDKHISQVYGLEGVKFKNMDLDNIEIGKAIDKDKLPDLFNHINDISWTRAFLHSLDLVNQKQENWQNWIRKIHTQISLGRESFQLALDFHLDSGESKFSRLADVSRVIQEWCNRNNGALYNKIKEWLGDDEASDEKNKQLQTFDNEINKLLGVDNKPDKIKHEDLNGYLRDYSAYDLMSLSTLNNNNALYHNLLDRIRGKKLKQLCEILQEHQDSLEADLQSLKEYLENYGKDKNEPDEGYYKKMEYLFNALSQYKENGNTEEVYMLTRGSTKNRVLKSDEKGQKTDALILLGRYDTLNIEPARPMLRCKLPKFPEQDLREGKVDKYPSFFVRRELAIPIRLRKKSWRSIPQEELHVKNKGVFAALSIVLTLRSTRLDFLTRLLKVINRSTCGEKIIEFPQHLVELDGYFSENDVAFLSEGGGDILLVFLGKPDERLENVFKMQNVIFQDFQVDRTELLLTPCCVEYAAIATQKELNKNSNQFRVSVHVRLKEDRTLSTANESFKKEFNKKLAELDEKNKNNKKNNTDSENDYLYLYYTLTRTPGRMDYSMRIKVRRGPDECGDRRSDYCKPIAIKKNEIYESLSSILDQEGIVERVQTNIGWVEACDRDEIHRSRCPSV